MCSTRECDVALNLYCSNSLGNIKKMSKILFPLCHLHKRVQFTLFSRIIFIWYLMFLEKRELLLSKNKIPAGQLLGLSLVYMTRISREIVYLEECSDTKEVKMFWFIKLI